MPASDVLKNFRKDGYGDSKGEEKSSSGPRSFKLTEDEAKELQGGEGMEQHCLVTGRLGAGGEFTVTSVHSSDGSTMPDQDRMAEEAMAKSQQPPTMRPQTMPSPS